MQDRHIKRAYTGCVTKKYYRSTINMKYIEWLKAQPRANVNVCVCVCLQSEYTYRPIGTIRFGICKYIKQNVTSSLTHTHVWIDFRLHNFTTHS